MVLRVQAKACRPCVLLAFVLLCGCSHLATTTSTTQKLSLSGKVMGGQQPITGATIQLYQVGTGGDGSSSASILNNGVTVTTDGSGNFVLTGKYTCPVSNPEVYMLASGGNPGLASNTNNSASDILVALGACNSLTSSQSIFADEVTTVAAVAALAPYISGPAAIGYSSSDADSAGLISRFALATVLANTVTGASPGTSVPTGYSVPSTTINTLANIIAACINTSGGVAGDMSACGDLFSDATPSGGTAPTNVVNALLNILNNPTANLTPLENLAGTTTPFQPSLTSPPTTWAVELADTAATWTGGGDGVWRRDANSIYGEAYTFDPCNAHQPGSGEYHYHENPVCLRYQLNDNITGTNVGTATATYTETTGTHTHSPILGWAFDGNPIYGPYGYSNPTDPTSAVRRMVSSYALRTDNTTTRTSLPAWAQAYQGITTLTSSQYGPAVSSTYPLGRYVEDYDYTPGSVDLDQYNGRYCVTPDFPNGTYAYFVTISSTGAAAFPYYLGPQFYATESGGNVTSITESTTTYYNSHALTGSASASPSLYSWLLKYTSQLAEILYDKNGTVTGPTTTWTGNSSAIDADIQEIRYSTSYVYLNISGLASHLMGPWYLNQAKTTAFPNLPTNQNTYSRIPLSTTIPTGKPLTSGGAQGRWVNGVSMFNMLDFASWSNSSQADVMPGMP